MAFGFFDATQNQTPESVARTRDMIRALMSARGSPQNVGEGLNALGDGIVANVLGRRADAGEAAGKAAWESEWNPIMESLMGGGAPAVSTPDFAGGLSTAPEPLDPASARVAQAHSGSALPGSFLSALDTHEGGGDYDTLFGHAQKNGPFAGTSVSSMPIGDVLAFASPSGAYGQHVKGKVGRVATPMGRHQIVGTTLRSAAAELGLDPSTPFNAQTQDTIAAHLARKRIQSADTMDGKISALRSEWEGFKNVPRAQMMQIVSDLETMPAGGGAVAANEAMASGQMAGGPTIIDPGIIGGAASAPPDPNIAPEWATNPNMGGVPPVEPTALAPIETVATEPMASPMLPEPQMTQDMPVQAGGFPMEEMAGMNPQFLGGPAAPTPTVAQALAPQMQPQGAQQGGQRGPTIAQLLQAAQNPYAPPAAQGIIKGLIEQQLQGADPMRAIELERAQLELDQMRNPQPEQTAEMQNLQWRASQAGLQPGTPEYSDFILSGGKQADQTNVTVNNGEGSKFYDELDKSQATTFGALAEAGVQARSKMAQIDRLEGLLTEAQTGGLAMIKQAAGEYGIATEGLSDIQAAQALINELVPQQRQPGSGPMSDADLALFKQSLPRLINQPGGNQTIINTMRGITQYQIQMGEIADAVADRQLTPAQAREQIRNLPNPLAAITKQERSGATSAAPEGVDPELWQEMTPEERSAWN